MPKKLLTHSQWQYQSAENCASYHNDERRNRPHQNTIPYNICIGYWSSWRKEMKVDLYKTLVRPHFECVSAGHLITPKIINQSINHSIKRF